MFLSGIKVYDYCSVFNESNLVLRDSDFFFGFSVELFFSGGTSSKYSDWESLHSAATCFESHGVSGITASIDTILFARYTEIEEKIVKLMKNCENTTFMNYFGNVITLPEAMKNKSVLVDTSEFSDEFNWLYAKYCMMG